MPIPRLVKLGAVIVIALLLVTFLLPALSDDGSGFRTSIFAMTPDGEVQVYAENPGDPFVPATIIQVSGTTVTYIRWETDYKAVSPDYDQYTVPFGNLEVTAIQPSGVACGGPMKSMDFSIDATRDVDIWYNLTSVSLTADWILSHIQNNGCLLTGDYTLRYTVSLTVRAIGIGELPTDTDTGIYNTAVTLSTGSIDVIESTTGG